MLEKIWEEEDPLAANIAKLKQLADDKLKELGHDPQSTSEADS